MRWIKPHRTFLLFVFLGFALRGLYAFAQQPESASGSTDEEEEKSSPHTPEVQISMRLMTGFEVEHDRPVGRQSGLEDTQFGYFLQQARVKLRVRLSDSIRTNLSAELSDALDTLDGEKFAVVHDKVPYLRNAYLNIRFVRAFQLMAGRFKRPFSKLENRSTGLLPFRGRGLSNEVIVEEADWGDRGIGLMLWGRLKSPDLTWKVSLTNPRWVSNKETQKNGITAHGRVSFDPVEFFSVGLNGGYQFFTHTELELPRRHHVAFGGDVRLKSRGFYLALEAIAGQRDIVDTSVISPVTDAPVIRHWNPYAFGITGYTAYDLSLPRNMVLQPVGFIEFADSDLTFSSTEGIRSVMGLNLIFGKQLRIMPQIEIIRPLQVAGSGWVDPIERPLNQWENQETYYLLLSLQM